ncbi:MAG TPA: flagellar hook-associated protein FlgK [Kineosporiaceae bacterium]|nr:flagellar hook-associated protein FlgK [Kineosporiaceae bacterium]
MAVPSSSTELCEAAMTAFSALNTSISGLAAAQRAVDITSQNIANVNTPGYSRQQIRLSSVGSTTAAHFYTGDNSAILGGVKIDDVLRVRDAFLETARVNAGATKEALAVQASALSGVEGLLNEPGDDGIQAVIDDFYASWHNLAANPGTSRDAAAGQVLQAATALVNQLHFVSSGIDERWSNAQSQLTATVNDLNQATADLAVVNQNILEGAVDEHPINELLDRRDSLVRTIGELSGARAVVKTDNTVDVMINNISVVSGNRALPVTVAGATSIGGVAADPPHLMSGVNNAPISGGKLAGLLAALGTDIPTVATQLDGVATSMRDAVNTLHSAGYTTGGDTGLDFFSGTGAGDLAVVPETGADLALSVEPGVVDGGNAEAIADLALDENAEAVLGGPGPSVRLRALASEIGTKLQSLNRAVEVQDSVFATADAAINADAGVSIDEEMTSLLMYQRSYQASARVISTIDELLDTLINRTAV